MQGAFIVLDGPDGSGTTLHTRLLSQRLGNEGHTVVQTAEPSDGSIGKFVRQMLKSGELAGDALQLLFTADRADHIGRVLEPAIRTGKTVICDRYISSTIAYGEALGFDSEWLESLNKKFIRPDTLLFLLPPIEVILKRLTERKSHESLETTELQTKVHAAYRKFAKKDSKIIVINTNGPKEEVAEKIWDSIKNLS